jgi:hypothetical protein
MAREKLSSMRSLVVVLATASMAWSGVSAGSHMTVAGVSRYIDSSFGFSFWYPSAWKVTDEPVADPTGGGWFRDGKIVRTLLIHNPAASDGDNQPPGVIVQELLAPMGLTELGHSASASPVGMDQKYFFDAETRRWMYAELSEAPDGTPPNPPHALRVSGGTMGGQPVFGGAVRHGAEVIVPLNGSHFLAITTLDTGGDFSHVYLAKTVMATDPNSGRRESARVQAETIRREAVELRAIGDH